MNAHRIALFLAVVSLAFVLAVGCGKAPDQPANQAENPQGQSVQQPPGGSQQPGNLTRIALSARCWKEVGASYYRICALNGANFEPIWLTPEGYNCDNPVCSPDGEMVAFFTTIRGVRGIGVVRSGATWDKRDLVRESNDAAKVSDRLLVWSSDGAKIIYCAEEQNGAVLHAFALDPVSLRTEPLQKITRSQGFQFVLGGRVVVVDPWNRRLSASPDGKYRVEVVQRLNRVVKISGPETAGVKEIPLPQDAAGIFSVGDWSPDGGRVLVQCDAAGEGVAPAIFVVGVDAGTLTKLCDGLNGRWSCDGKYVVFETPTVDTPFTDRTGGRRRDLTLKCNSLGIIPASGGEQRALVSGVMTLRGHSTAFARAPQATVDFANFAALPPVTAPHLTPPATPASTVTTPTPVTTPVGTPAPSPAVRHAAGNIALREIGSFVSNSGFTAFADVERDGRTEIVVANEVPGRQTKFEVGIYALSSGAYSLKDKYEAAGRSEEQKFRKKFANSPFAPVAADEAAKLLPQGARVLWAGKAALSGGEAETLVCYLVPENDSRWKAVLSIFKNTAAAGDDEAASVVVGEGRGASPRNANATLTDLDGDGKKELVLAQTTTVDEGWRENLKIFSLTSP